MSRITALLLLMCASLGAQDPVLESLRQEGHWKQVRTRVELWYRAHPEDPAAMVWMSRVKQVFGQLPEALDLARKAAALRPADADIQSQLAGVAGMSIGSAEGMFKQVALAREMKQAGEAALTLKPDHEEAANNMLQYYLQAPVIAGGGEGKALALAQKFTQLRPVSGLLMQAKLAFKKGDRNAALALVKQALVKDPHSYDAQVSLANGFLLLKPKDLEQALAGFRLAAAGHPREAEAHAQIAAILAEQGKWADLEAALAEARRLVPDNLLPYFRAGKLLLEENLELGRAERLLKVYLSQGTEGGAPDHAVAHWRLGQIMEKQGRKAEAVAEWQTALSLRPTLKAAQKDLDRLSKG